MCLILIHIHQTKLSLPIGLIILLWSSITNEVWNLHTSQSYHLFHLKNLRRNQALFTVSLLSFLGFLLINVSKIFEIFSLPIKFTLLHLLVLLGLFLQDHQLKLTSSKLAYHLWTGLRLFYPTFLDNLLICI
jgi:hypothetical protein